MNLGFLEWKLSEVSDTIAAPALKRYVKCPKLKKKYYGAKLYFGFLEYYLFRESSNDSWFLNKSSRVESHPCGVRGSCYQEAECPKVCKSHHLVENACLSEGSRCHLPTITKTEVPKVQNVKPEVVRGQDQAPGEKKSNPNVQRGPLCGPRPSNAR